MKTVKVRVVPRAKRERVIPFNDSLKVYLQVPALEGRANKRLIEVLAEYYGLKKYNLAILSGEKQRDKIICLGR